MITLTLPFPPSTNTYIRHSKGMHFPTKQAKAFRKAVAEIVAEQGVTSTDQRLHVTLRLFAPTLAHRDIDNYVKPVLDALMHAGCFADDEQVDELLVVRGPLLRGGQVRVVIVEHAVQHPQQAALPMPPVPRKLTAKELRQSEVDSRVPLA